MGLKPAAAHVLPPGVGAALALAVAAGVLFTAKSSADLDASGPGQNGLLPPPQGHMGWGRGYKSGSFLRVEGEGEASCAAAGNV